MLLVLSWGVFAFIPAGETSFPNSRFKCFWGPFSFILLVSLLRTRSFSYFTKLTTAHWSCEKKITCSVGQTQPWTPPFRHLRVTSRLITALVTQLNYSTCGFIISELCSFCQCVQTAVDRQAFFFQSGKQAWNCSLKVIGIDHQPHKYIMLI